MGRVFLARDPQLDRTIALKTLLNEALITPAQRERFLAEARIAAKLHHPHIVPIHDVGTFKSPSGDVPYFTMDVIEGQSLAAALPTLPLREFLGILRDVAAALHVAHEAGIVHRDVKPANILLDAAHCAFVTDFGLAQEVRAPESTAAAGRGGGKGGGGGGGTLHYMAPEQASAGAAGVDRRADVWALGVILYEGLAGTRPFDAPSEHMIRLAILDRTPAPPSRAA
ncbi:MAG: serine/threonine protein kinase, partial [Planctomycetes bacterium]|nr:serine/threonine protein kinase [Planctomycetota bacterium]